MTRMTNLLAVIDKEKHKHRLILDKLHPGLNISLAESNLQLPKNKRDSWRIHIYILVDGSVKAYFKLPISVPLY